MRFWVPGCQTVPSRPESFRKVLEESTGRGWKAGVTPASSLSPRTEGHGSPDARASSHLPPGHKHSLPIAIRIWMQETKCNKPTSPSTGWAHPPTLGPPAASALRGTPSGGRPLPSPPREGPRLFAMNVTFILLGCVQSQVRLLQIEYRNIHFSFQKRALKCQIKLNEIIASGGTQISCRWCCPPANSPNLLAPPQSRPTWARLGRVQTHLLDERMAFASV